MYKKSTRNYTILFSLQNEAATKAHFSYFKGIKPTTGFYEINKLVASEYLVEIECRSVVAEK